MPPGRAAPDATCDDSPGPDQAPGYRTRPGPPPSAALPRTRSCSPPAAARSDLSVAPGYGTTQAMRSARTAGCLPRPAPSAYRAAYGRCAGGHWRRARRQQDGGLGGRRPPWEAGGNTEMAHNISSERVLGGVNGERGRGEAPTVSAAP